MEPSKAVELRLRKQLSNISRNDYELFLLHLQPLKRWDERFGTTQIMNQFKSISEMKRFLQQVKTDISSVIIIFLLPEGVSLISDQRLASVGFCVLVLMAQPG